MNELEQRLSNTLGREARLWKAVVNYGTVDSSVSIHMAKVEKDDSFQPCCYYWESEKGWELMIGFFIGSIKENEKQDRRAINRYCLRLLRRIKDTINFMRKQKATKTEIESEITYKVFSECMGMKTVMI